MSNGTKKTIIIISLLAICTISFLPYLDMYGKEQNEKILKSSMITYAAARGVNGAISVIQETQVGAGIVLQPGQVLDPLNDLIERFSTVILFSMASLGIQNMMIYLGSSMLVKFMILISSISIIVLLLIFKIHVSNIHTIMMKILIVGLFLRFSVPTVTIANQFLYSAFLENKVTEAVEGFEQEELTSDEEEDKSLWDSIVGSVSDATDEIGKFIANIEAITRRVIDLIAIFIIQTVLIPSLFLLFIIKWGNRSIQQSESIVNKIFQIK
jgi:hypothetical protein